MAIIASVFPDTLSPVHHVQPLLTFEPSWIPSIVFHTLLYLLMMIQRPVSADFFHKGNDSHTEKIKIDVNSMDIMVWRSQPCEREPRPTRVERSGKKENSNQ